MGGNWGADYNEDSTMTTSVASKKPSRHQHSASINSAKQLSSVYGGNKSKTKQQHSMNAEIIFPPQLDININGKVGETKSPVS